MKILGIDPGSEESALFGWDNEKEELFCDARKVGNDKVFNYYKHNFDVVVCEMIASYGMPVGKSIFNTCVWIGRFWQASPIPFETVLVKKIRAHHCGNARAKDGNVIQALKDRFEPDLKPRQRPKGLFKGVSRDVWQAASTAIYWGDMEKIGIK